MLVYEVYLGAKPRRRAMRCFLNQTQPSYEDARLI